MNLEQKFDSIVGAVKRGFAKDNYKTTKPAKSEAQERAERTTRAPRETVQEQVSRIDMPLAAIMERLAGLPIAKDLNPTYNQLVSAFTENITVTLTQDDMMTFIDPTHERQLIPRILSGPFRHGDAKFTEAGFYQELAHVLIAYGLDENGQRNCMRIQRGELAPARKTAQLDSLSSPLMIERFEALAFDLIAVAEKGEVPKPAIQLVPLFYGLSREDKRAVLMAWFERVAETMWE